MACQIHLLLSTAGKKVCLKRTVEYYKAEKLVKGWKSLDPAGKQEEEMHPVFWKSSLFYIILLNHSLSSHSY